ncbi:MAG: polyprenyl synthetase [Flavobacteriales bacterium]|nr:polyprenyl synthetase [Flavobacteriales bacterium]|tara:strand:- start:1379 stop:2356 length:978 start_codon:yes stop_codon:yes gene_type:complete
MISVESIKAPIAEEMSLFEKKFKEAMKGNAPLLDKITHYIVKRKGKQMRPMFVFLAANLCGGVSERSYRAANLIEMIHTATLVHDDVVDDANKRRGFFSVNALWKNKIAVLVGDFLLSKGLQLAAQHKDYDFLEIISEVTKQMSEGELLQIEKARRLDIKEDIYFEIIRQKTATLIAACCATGASSAGANEDEVERLRLLGEKIGIAFQIKDDLFDYESSVSLIGKPVGIDIKERKMTLPLIYALNNSSKKDKRWMINIVKNRNEDQKMVTQLIEKVKVSGGIEYTKKKMYQFREEAMGIIKTYPDTPSRQSLIDLILYTTERNK